MALGSRPRTFSFWLSFSHSTVFKIYPCCSSAPSVNSYSRVYFHHSLLITVLPTPPVVAFPMLHYRKYHNKHLWKCSLCIYVRISPRHTTRREITQCYFRYYHNCSSKRWCEIGIIVFRDTDGETKASRDYIICPRLASRASIQMSVFSEVHTLLSP